VGRQGADTCRGRRWAGRAPVVLLVVLATVVNGVVSRGAASAMVCGSTLSGPLTITAAAGPVEVGGPAGSSCAPDQVRGHLAVLGARGPVHIGRTAVSGPILLMGDTGGLTVTGASTTGLDAVANSGRLAFQADSVYGTLTTSWGTGSLELSSDTVTGGANVSFNSASPGAVRPGNTVSANTVGGGLDCELNTPAPLDYGVANHVSGRATGQCAKLG
jgi:hypothetical protein